MYDPSEHVGYGSHRETQRQTESEPDRARATQVVNELSPAAKELVREHEQSGSEAPTMQQITQMVLRAKCAPPPLSVSLFLALSKKASSVQVCAAL